MRSLPVPSSRAAAREAAGPSGVQAPRLAGDDEPSRTRRPCGRRRAGRRAAARPRRPPRRSARPAPCGARPAPGPSGPARRASRRPRRPWPSARHRPASSSACALLDGDEEPAEVGDGVDPELGLRRVGGPAGEDDLDEGIAAQALGEGQPGRLPDDGDVRAAPRGPGRAASTASAPRLASSSSATRASTTRPGTARRDQLLGGDDHRRDAALHVARAAPAQAVRLDRWGERIGMPSTPTVSRCPVSTTVGPDVLARTDGDQARPVGRGPAA